MTNKKFLYDVERKPAIKNIVGKKRLHMSERNVPFSDHFFSSFVKNLNQEDFINYANCEDLRERLAIKHGVLPENIFIGSGSDFVLSAIFNSFVTRDSKVIMPEAHFPMYDVYLKQNQGIKQTFKYFIGPTGLLTLDVFAPDNVDEISLIVLGNPNSPVGDIISLESIIKLTGLGAPVVLDQAYGDFGKTEVPIGMINNGIIFVNSFSKSFGGAGCRIGYAIGSKEHINVISKFRQMFELSNVSKKFALHLLDNIGEVEAYVNSIIQEREILKCLLRGVQYGNWVHLPESFNVPDEWEIKEGVFLPCFKDKFKRISIFSGIHNYVK